MSKVLTSTDVDLIFAKVGLVCVCLLPAGRVGGHDEEVLTACP